MGDIIAADPTRIVFHSEVILAALKKLKGHPKTKGWVGRHDVHLAYCGIKPMRTRVTTPAVYPVPETVDLSASKHELSFMAFLWKQQNPHCFLCAAKRTILRWHDMDRLAPVEEPPAPLEPLPEETAPKPSPEMEAVASSLEAEASEQSAPTIVTNIPTAISSYCADYAPAVGPLYAAAVESPRTALMTAEAVKDPVEATRDFQRMSTSSQVQAAEEMEQLPMLDDQGLDMTSPSEDEAEEFYLDEGTDEGWDEGLGEGVGDLFEQSVHEEAEAQDIDTAIYKPITIPLDASSTHTALFHAMNGLMQGLATVSHQVSTVHQEVSALKQNVASLNQNVAGVNQKVAAVRRDIGRLNGNVGYLFEKIARNDMLSHIRVTWELEILNPAGLLLHGRTFHFQDDAPVEKAFRAMWNILGKNYETAWATHSIPVKLRPSAIEIKCIFFAHKPGSGAAITSLPNTAPGTPVVTDFISKIADPSISYLRDKVAGSSSEPNLIVIGEATIRGLYYNDPVTKRKLAQLERGVVFIHKYYGLPVQRIYAFLATAKSLPESSSTYLQSILNHYPGCFPVLTFLASKGQIDIFVV